MDARAEAKRTGTAARLAARSGEIKNSNTGISTAVYCNLIVLPKQFTSDFELLCRRNPVPLPLLEHTRPGQFESALAPGSDIRTDVPFYRVYRDGHLVKAEASDIVAEWSDQHVGFLIGCSFSLETALADAGLKARNMIEGKSPPVLKTSVRLSPSGVFGDCFQVVSMRWYHPDQLERVRNITRRLPRQHGEPVAWGWEGAQYLGLSSKLREKFVDYGEWSEPRDGEVPVFWGCGVTAEAAVRSAALPGTIMTHHAGYMFVTDAVAADIEGAS